MTSNPTWVLKRFPTGMPGPDDLMLEDRPMPFPQTGALLVKTLWLSVDPYMRARLSPAKNYAARRRERLPRMLTPWKVRWRRAP